MKRLIAIIMMGIVSICLMTIPSYATTTNNYNFNNIENIVISNDTLELEKRGFIVVSADVMENDSNKVLSKKINTNSGLYVYADSVVFNEELQMYESEQINGSPYKELYLANGTTENDYDLVVDFDYGHEMYISYCNQIEKISTTKTIKKIKKKVVKKSKKMTIKKAKKIIKKKTHLHIDKIKLIDKYIKGKWYCYYIYADGDVYVITIKNNKVQKLCQLN